MKRAYYLPIGLIIFVIAMMTWLLLLFFHRPKDPNVSDAVVRNSIPAKKTVSSAETLLTVRTRMQYERDDTTDSYVGSAQWTCCDSLRDLLKRVRARLDTADTIQTGIDTVKVTSERRNYTVRMSDSCRRALARLRAQRAENEAKLSLLRATHVMRSLFVYHNFLFQMPDSSVSPDEKKNGRTKTVAQYNKAAELLGWDPYCDVHTRVYAFDRAHYKGIRNVKEIYGYAPATLYYLAKCEYASPRTISAENTMVFVKKALVGFRRERAMSGDTLTVMDEPRIQEKLLRRWINNQLERFHRTVRR